jgi:hypothetical protein
MNDEFLRIASEDSFVSVLSEAKLLELLQRFNKPLMLSSDSLKYIQAAYEDIKEAIKVQKNSAFVHYHVNEDCTFSKKDISGTFVSETELLNNMMGIFDGDYQGYVFAVDNGFKCLRVNGMLIENVDPCFMHTANLKKHFNLLSPVSNLPNVFCHFEVDCRGGKFYAECFQPDGRIKEAVLEQDLRNILMNYLNEKIQGKVQPEFCTDYKNDEESVDIHIHDGKESAIIEVKFAFAKKYYAGKTFYRITKRAEEGYKQLDKYALHLAEDNRRIEYGYLYIFHMVDKTEDALRKDVCNILNSLKGELSFEFHSMYEDTLYNNMRGWKAS